MLSISNFKEQHKIRENIKLIFTKEVNKNVYATYNQIQMFKSNLRCANYYSTISYGTFTEYSYLM